MKLYKTPTGDVYAYEEDGSQDYLIPDNFVAITNEEAEVILEAQAQVQYAEWLAIQPTKEEQIAKLQEQINRLQQTGIN
jgi:hypothetical protein